MNTVSPIRSVVRSTPFLVALKKQFISPRAKDPDLRNREIVLNTLLLSTIVVLSFAIVILLVNLVTQHNTFLWGRTAGIAGILAVVAGIYATSRRGHVRTAAVAFVGIYFLLATAMAYRWGIDLPVALLLYALIITLAGILLSATYSLVAAVSSISALIALTSANSMGLIEYDRQWAADPSRVDAIGSIVGFSLVLSVLAIVCWLFNFQMERSLHRALKAEAGLAEQKAMLEVKFAERTHQLHVTQAEKLQQMYRFADFGQLSAALLHELANHLTTLHLDIEDLEKQNKSGILERAKSSMAYLDEMVRQVRDQLHGKSGLTNFVVAAEVDKVIGIMRQKAVELGVSIAWESKPDPQTTYYGDPTRFRQLIAILISNAIDAYADYQSDDRAVTITVKDQEGMLAISVEDHGKGIPMDKMATIFEPFYGTKTTGMGLGLFIAKQLTEDYFRGTLDVYTKPAHTVFTVKIPTTPETTAP